MRAKIEKQDLYLFDLRAINLRRLLNQSVFKRIVKGVYTTKVELSESEIKRLLVLNKEYLVADIGYSITNDKAYLDIRNKMGSKIWKKK